MNRIIASAILLTALLASVGCSSSKSLNLLENAAYSPNPEAGGYGYTADIMGGGAEVKRTAAASPIAEPYAVSYDFYAETQDYADDVPEEYGNAAAGADEVSPAAGERKIVYNVDLNLQTTEFDTAIAAIPARVEEMKGTIQSSFVSGFDLNARYQQRQANYTIRIPADSLDPFISAMSTDLHLVSQNKTSRDISGAYYDSAARLASLNLQKDRLMAILAQSNELEYMLKVERQLSEILLQIDTITASINRMDDSVNLSTVTIWLTEVGAYQNDIPLVKPVTFTARILTAFKDGFSNFLFLIQDFIVFLISMIPTIFLAALLIIALRRVGKKRFAARAAKKASASDNNTPQ